MTVFERVVQLLVFPVAFIPLFRLTVRVFQKLRITLGRQYYDVATGETYIAPRNILAGFLAYVIAAGLVGGVSGMTGAFGEAALVAEGLIAILSWIRMGTVCAMVLWTTFYLLCRDIDYVRTNGEGSDKKKLRTVYFVTLIALAIVFVACNVIQLIR